LLSTAQGYDKAHIVGCGAPSCAIRLEYHYPSSQYYEPE